MRDNLWHRDDIEDAYLSAIAEARSEVLIANSYFVPDEDSLYDFFGSDFAGLCSPSFSSGYYVMLSLERGEHTLHFTAAQESGFALDVTYNLNVR